MSMIDVIEEVALLQAFSKNRSNDPNRRNSYNPLKLLAAAVCFEMIGEALGNIGTGLAGAALATGMVAGDGGTAGSASAAAAATPAAVAAPRATPQPALGLTLSPASPTIGM